MELSRPIKRERVILRSSKDPDKQSTEAPLPSPGSISFASSLRKRTARERSGRGYGIAPVTPPTPPDVPFSAYGG